MPTRMSIPETSNSNGCSKCGTTNHFGKSSCCARGGTWFKKCGDSGDTNFDHTWAEGIQSCNGVLSSVKSPIKFMIRRVGVMSGPPNHSQLQIDPQNQVIVDRPASMSDAGTTDLETYARLIEVLVFIFVFAIDLRSQHLILLLPMVSFMNPSCRRAKI